MLKGVYHEANDTGAGPLSACCARRPGRGGEGVSRSEPGGYALRVPAPGEALDGGSGPSSRCDTPAEPVPHQRLQQGWLFATVPAANPGAAWRSSGEAPLSRLHHGLEGARVLQHWRRKELSSPGIAGNRAGTALTRAGTLIRACNDLGRRRPGCAEARRLCHLTGPADWRQRTPIPPDRLVTRELTVIAARAMEAVGWLTIPEGNGGGLTLVDAGRFRTGL